LSSVFCRALGLYAAVSWGRPQAQGGRAGIGPPPFTGPCPCRATGLGGGPGTACCLGPCRSRAGPKRRATGRADGPRAAWPYISTAVEAYHDPIPWWMLCSALVLGGRVQGTNPKRIVLPTLDRFYVCYVVDDSGVV
jgi:hypothetical protein